MNDESFPDFNDVAQTQHDPVVGQGDEDVRLRGALRQIIFLFKSDQAFLRNRSGLERFLRADVPHDVDSRFQSLS